MSRKANAAVEDAVFSRLGDERGDVVHVKWRPLYLRRRILFAFIFVFCALIATLAALDQTSKANSGLATPIKNLHYSWTYGPTAVLTIVAAVWSRVEFQTKQNAPWQGMLSKPQMEASKSVLLDYVSMLQPVTIVKALQNRHYFVAASVSSSLILRLLIIFSTGLFSLQPTPIIKGEAPVQLTTSIDTLNGSAKLSTASSKAYDDLNAIIYKNAPYGEGTTSKIAYQGVSFAGLPSNSLINATIETISSDLECESASFNAANFSTYGEGTLMTATCNMTIDFDSIWDNNDLRLITQVGPIQKCSNSNDTADQRIPLFIGNTYYSTDHPGINGNPPLLNLSLSRSVQHICKPTYTVRSILANLNTSGSSSMALGQYVGSGSIRKNLTAVDIASQAFSYMNTYMKSPRPADSDELFSGDNVTIDLSFKLGARLSGFQGTAQDIFERNMTVPLFSTFYHAITAQVVGEALFQPKLSNTTGNVISTEDRLLVTDLSLYAMITCLILLILLVVAMTLLKAHQAMAPWNPNTMMAVASILANNPALQEAIQGTGLISEKALHNHLSGQRYTTQITKDGLHVVIAGASMGETKSPREALATWKPFPSRFFRAGFFVILVGIIAALEGVLRISQTRNGLGTVSDSAFIHYSWTLLPAFIMVLISLCFGSIDFNVRSLAPYSKLKEKSGVDWQYLKTTNYMDSLGVVNILNALQRREFAVLITSFATIIGSVLTIVSSGLYSAMDTSAVSSVNFTQGSMPMNPLTFSHKLSVMNQANLTTSIQNTKYGVTGAQTASEILQNNLSFPQWTWNELAFPNMTLQLPVTEENTTGLYADILLPASRSSLDCQLRNLSQLPHSFTAMPTDSTSPYAGPTLLVNTTVLPCFQDESIRSEQIQIRGAGMNTAVEGKYLPVGYFGSTLQSICYLNGSSLQATYERNSAYNFNKNQVTYIWGKTTANKLENLVELACMDSPETVQTKVRLKLPELTIDETRPPATIESTATKADNVLLPLNDAWYYLQSYDESATGLGSFFQALVAGKYAIPREYLRDIDRTDTVVEAIKYQHRIIRAQQLGLDAQEAADDILKSKPLLGNLTNPSDRRLFQDAASTRALEALLAIMLVLGIVSSILLNTDGVLPKNPNSIAAIASLLADCNFLEFFHHVPDPTDEKIGTTVFSKSRFHLGWLENEDSPGPNLMNSSLPSFQTPALSDDAKFTIYVDDYEGRPF
ncbi:hypothetical protein N7468_010648 [Penicillium chermesinum]|uniref:Uncharacterized protein n=1 Tax=Penicillium chermesinum TaxID=63820 RepID=A0A9W9TA82_9EURO|nr:uncharacterized protein N7468_010648 [Penicillium chermesinum]KAJ5214969.1 hypothetical protein N7468_010648 [Penicillium chermesinum]